MHLRLALNLRRREDSTGGLNKSSDHDRSVVSGFTGMWSMKKENTPKCSGFDKLEDNNDSFRLDRSALRDFKKQNHHTALSVASVSDASESDDDADSFADDGCDSQMDLADEHDKGQQHSSLGRHIQRAQRPPTSPTLRLIPKPVRRRYKIDVEEPVHWVHSKSPKKHLELNITATRHAALRSARPATITRRMQTRGHSMISTIS
jgi:hypothetical protein